MFDHKHYIPVLRWKRAKWKALGELASGDHDYVTPFLELTPLSFRAKRNEPAPPDPRGVLAKNAADILKYWRQAPFFMDLCHLRAGPDLGNGHHAFQFLAERTRDGGLHLISVTGLNRAPAYQTAIASITAADGFGICIRVHPTEIQSHDFSTTLSPTRQILGNVSATGYAFWREVNGGEEFCARPVKPFERGRPWLRWTRSLCKFNCGKKRR